MSSHSYLIIIGGFAGSGKSTLAKNIGKVFSIPVFEIDQIARSIKDSKDFHGNNGEAYGIAFDLFFSFARCHLQNQGSIILDQNIGHSMTWHNIEELKMSLGNVEVIIFLLDCPYELCLSRVAARTEHPNLHEVTPEILHEHKYKWDYLNENELPDAIRLDATRSKDVVFNEVMSYLEPSFQIHT